MVLTAPEYLLCLQNGNFDRPNRLFHRFVRYECNVTRIIVLACSVAKTWENVNTDHADVKELIPEFYQPPGDFLVNSMVREILTCGSAIQQNNYNRIWNWVCVVMG